jgi:N-acetyl-gamma-glutamyl-phosphate reductase
MRIAVVGASGFTGAEMLRLIAGHPQLELSGLFGASSAGDPLAQHYPGLDRKNRHQLQATSAEAVAQVADWAVLGLPHGSSARLAAELLELGVGVVDLSASFRLPAALYAEHYGDHPCPELMGSAVYGLPELHRQKLPGARLIAGPGCFPTGVTLACAPFLQAGLIAEGLLIADCKTGVTGAGAKLASGSQFCRVADTIMPYKVEGHRHTPEIAHNLSALAKSPLKVRFTPHLLPIRRGILSTCYLPLAAGVGAKDLRLALHEFCDDEPFLHALPSGLQPNLARVAGTNEVEIQVVCDEQTGLAVITSAIDNLCKGSSGGALQALNIALGFDEGAGLSGLSATLP